MAAVEINHHVFQTYHKLRIGIAGLALFFPILLYVLGRFNGLDGAGHSWSAYYHYSPVTRDVFVGVLWAIGVFFILYKGYSKNENIGLNIAGFFAICVAMFPMNLYDAKVEGEQIPCATSQILGSYAQNHEHYYFKDEETRIGPNTVNGKDVYAICNTGAHFHLFGLVISLHGLFALIFFLSAAFVAAFTSSATLHHLKRPLIEAALKWFYLFAGIMMFAVPTALFFASKAIDTLGPSAIFYMETAALMAFLLYWGVKTVELWAINDDFILADPELLTGMGIQ